MRYFPCLALLALLIAASMEARPQAADLIEEIETTGHTPRALRAEIRTLERDMFELFNSLNSNDEFDVTCDYRTPTGSNIPLWQCEPAFFRLAENREYMQMKDNAAVGAGLRGFGYLPRRRDDIAFMQREKAAQMQEEMRALALEHPELATAIVTLHARRLQLAEMEGGSKE